MHFDLHFRSIVQEQIDEAAEDMRSWEEQPRIDEGEESRLRENIQLFDHMKSRDGLRIAGVDGSGDFPSVSYADSFVYFAVAQGAVYESDPVSGLREVDPMPETVVNVAWIPEEEGVRKEKLDEAFAKLAGAPIREVIGRSDYRTIKSEESGSGNTIDMLIDGLIRPHAADAGNIGIQLRSTAELGAALRAILGKYDPSYVLMDGTFSLPFVSRNFESLFYEHLKRLCCVEARSRGIGFFALSKSHGLPAIDLLEELAREKRALPSGGVAEHWYLRLPAPGVDDWEFPLIQSRRLPPPGAITYLFRFHRTTPVMRLDIDIEFWYRYVRGATEEETRNNEQRIFEDLDYASHDQRSYGYPYPIKASHDRASLTQAERVVLRKQIIDAALRKGMRRALFRDAAEATGHA